MCPLTLQNMSFFYILNIKQTQGLILPRTGNYSTELRISEHCDLTPLLTHAIITSLILREVFMATTLPQFSKIDPATIEPTLDTLLQQCRDELARLLEQPGPFTWENLNKPLEAKDDKLHQYWSVINHLNAVVNTPELRKAYDACLPKLSEYHTEIGQNRKLFEAFQQVAQSPNLNQAQQSALQHAIRDFKLSGVHLDEQPKKRFAELRKELSALTNKFDQNLLDATHAWSKLITDKSELAGIPEMSIEAAKQAAEQQEQQGYLLTLDMPCYHAVITYADSRELREEMYVAFTTRASDQGPNAGQWDNSKVMQDILNKRHELAQLLQYDNYAQVSLEPKMAENTQAVMDFLQQLADASHPRAQAEYKFLQHFAAEHLALTELNAWDVAYASEKLRQFKYDISQEDLRPYFPEYKVLAGLFAVVENLYGIRIEEEEEFDAWHPDVRFFSIYEDNELRGQFYLDLYARKNKRGGAWMDDCRGRRVLENGEIQTPIAMLTCNLNPPVGDKPALFTHYEVLTLFHEFGHGLQHMLTKIDVADVAGICGVPWDAVELPSQFMENWCWQAEALPLIAEHYQTGAPLPEELRQKMLAAKNFQSAMQSVRQLEFSIFDFRLHMEFDPKQEQQISNILAQVRKDVCVVPVPPFNRFQHGFSHIFAGGYAAGYYSYKWAEVLSSDAFSKFEERGIFDETTGHEFKSIILEQGGAADPMDLFVQFRGRKPNIDALLRHTGIIETEESAL